MNKHIFAAGFFLVLSGAMVYVGVLFKASSFFVYSAGFGLISLMHAFHAGRSKYLGSHFTESELPAEIYEVIRRVDNGAFAPVLLVLRNKESKYVTCLFKTVNHVNTFEKFYIKGEGLQFLVPKKLKPVVTEDVGGILQVCD